MGTNQNKNIFYSVLFCSDVYEASYDTSDSAIERIIWPVRWTCISIYYDIAIIHIIYTTTVLFDTLIKALSNRLALFVMDLKFANYQDLKNKLN